jgi:hypothetical protein
VIETLVGWAIGGVARLIPEWFKGYRVDKKFSHDEKMLAKSIELAKIQANSSSVVSNNDKEIASIHAITEAVKGQSTLTGTWVDALSASVRPVITYLIVALYVAVKVKMMHESALITWGVEDSALLDAVISFWFLDRVMRK